MGHRDTSEVSPHRPARAHRLRNTVGAAVAFPLGIYIISVLRHTPANSPGIYYRPFFTLQYSNGIYRYRIIGRELIIGISNVINSLGGGPRVTGLTAATHSVEASMFTAFVIVNGVALLGFSILLCLVTARDQEWLPAYLILVTMTAISNYVVTPYDFLSYGFIAAALLLALSGRSRSWIWCVPIAILGTATRESFLVVVAALVATRMSEPGSIRELGLVPRRDDRLWQSTEAVAVSSLGTYVVLRLVLSRGTDSNMFVQSMPGASNFNWASVVALVIVGLSALALASQIPSVDVPDPGLSKQRRRALILLWALSTPYLLVSALGGIWSEALRLVLPVAICHYVVSWHFSRCGLDPSPKALGKHVGEAISEA